MNFGSCANGVHDRRARREPEARVVPRGIVLAARVAKADDEADRCIHGGRKACRSNEKARR